MLEGIIGALPFLFLKEHGGTNMNSKQASRALRSSSTSKIQRQLAGSALSQAKSGHQTGKKMEGVASAALNSPKYSSTTKTLAGSVLSQSNKNR